MSRTQRNSMSARETLEDLFTAFLRARSQLTGEDKIVNVANPAQVATIRSNTAPTACGQSMSQTIDEALQVFSHRVAMDNSRFFGFIPSPVHYSSYLGDLMTSMFNTHAGSWYQSSGPSAVENALVAWLTEQAGLPPASAGGLFVSGGSMANLTAIVAARDAKLAFENRPKARVYMSEQTHSSLQKGLGIAGFDRSQTRLVPRDDQFRMKSDSLRQMIAKDRADGLIPFLIVATCGFTNTGGIDPLNDLADVAEDEDLWLHVDGAYGASVVLSQKHKQLASGIGRAHSLSWDAHKWLFQTYACGVLLVRDKRSLVQSFATNASYIQDANETSADEINFWNRGMELTRPARAMKLWFTLRLLGTDKIEAMIDHGIGLAETAEQSLRQRPNWQLTTSAQLGIVNFRFWPEAWDRRDGETAQKAEMINAEISRRAIALNIAAPLTTRLNGTLNLRMCAIHPDLTSEHMVRILDELDRLGMEAVKTHEGSDRRSADGETIFGAQAVKHGNGVRQFGSSVIVDLLGP